MTGGLWKDGERLAPPLNPEAQVHLFGQEVNPETSVTGKIDVRGEVA